MPATPVWNLNPDDPNAETIRQAANLLVAGELVAFPTETVYGLGANALDAHAVAKIFLAKGRPSSNPIIVHIPDVDTVGMVTAVWPKVAVKLAEQFWPGPLTLVLQRNPRIPDIVTAGGETVGVRCPDNTIARALIRAAGVPIAAPSANRSMELSPTRAEHVLKSLDGRIAAILDGGPCRGGIESTVLDLTEDVPRLLRPGLISLGMLEAVVGEIRGSTTTAGPSRSPGQMAKHYSPRTPLVLANGKAEVERFQIEMRERGLRIACVNISGEPAEYAETLYAILHELDCGHYDFIIVEMPPDKPEWAAVQDRLTRAAALTHAAQTDTFMNGTTC